jgi:hypothetical protein
MGRESFPSVAEKPDLAMELDGVKTFAPFQQDPSRPWIKSRAGGAEDAFLRANLSINTNHSS